MSIGVQAQYQFPACWASWNSGTTYTGGDQVSYNNGNYEAKWSTDTQPGSDGSWTLVSKCGDGGLGEDYTGPQRIIGYLPTWIPDYDISTFDPSVVTHVNIAFMMFQQNNNNYGSADFASIAFNATEARKVDSVLHDLGVLQRAHQKGVTVSAALGGATDYAFLWLMEKYYNNDAKLEEIANLIVNYVNTNNLDGIDLDLECWWADAAITGTVEIGGRVRGDKWGGTDEGPHEAALGLTRLTQKLRLKMPDKLISGAVFGTSWYGNNYDDAMAEYMDWVGLMTYDFTGSWNESPKGPHSALHTVQPGTYTGQSANNPIYSAEDALEYWMGLAPAAWNHDGGFNIPKSKLVIGVPMYGYDLSTRKPNNGNGFLFIPYNKIVAQYPNAPTNYDPKDPYNMGGFIGADGKQIYYETPKRAAAKIEYTKSHGHQGVIVWELTQDLPFNNNGSLLKAMNEAAGTGVELNAKPTVSLSSPEANTTYPSGSAVTIEANASDSDGSVTKVEFLVNGTVAGTDTSAPYSFTVTDLADGSYSISARATDNEGATATSTSVNVIIGESDNAAPVVSITTPVNNAKITEGSAINITASASDSDGSIISVQFLVDGSLVGEATSAPYTFIWNNAAVGNYTLTAVATDDEGASTTSSAVLVEVEENTGSDCEVPAWDPAKAYNGGALVSYEGNTYEAQWWTQGDNPAQPVDVGVWELIGPCGDGDEPINQAPTVSLTSPSPGANFTSGSSVNITATASDSDGSVTKVAFYAGSTLLGEDTTAPYSFSWTAGAGGAYELKATATDNEGKSSSASVNVTVDDIGCTVPAWSATGVYTKGMQVSYNGNTYEAKWWTQGENPAQAGDWGAWKLLGSCGASSLMVESESSAMKMQNSETGLRIYPNPSAVGSVVQLKFSSDIKEAKVYIQSMIGERSYSETLSSQNGIAELKIPELPRGLYIIKVISGDKMWTKNHVIK
ncbi:hypothetical protein GCM10011506_45470 [Marivirga lumbricoides]|uniref:chitinase n=2 Tax=Marivirga lumbricoides TaxID=1046115 RepID=A0ABQ1NCP9_9BACT|nr:hypothetical protein GCM10011506_45470 [Marivirga lumbricoides]